MFRGWLRSWRELALEWYTGDAPFTMLPPQLKSLDLKPGLQSLALVWPENSPPLWEALPPSLTHLEIPSKIWSKPPWQMLPPKLASLSYFATGLIPEFMRNVPRTLTKLEVQTFTDD